MAERALRWLHLTDLHIGNASESQRSALRSLLASVIEHAADTPFDAVILSGDLAYSGQQSEYEDLRDLLIRPLREHELCREATFIAAPGNHDLNCDVEYPPNWATFGRQRQERFFATGEEGKRTRGSRANAFAAYSKFVRDCGIQSVDPTSQPAAIVRVGRQDRQIRVISVVTAFFSDKESPDHRKAPAPVLALRTALHDIARDDMVLVVGHHPPEWFTQDTELHLRSLLVERNVIYLHGHEHKTKTIFGPRGLISIGFGAAYQAPQEVSSPTYYRNSFAICELTSELHVKIVSWDHEYGRWRPDKNLSADFIDPSDRLSDGFRLNLPSTLLTDKPRGHASIAAAVRKELSVEDCLWLAGDSASRWTSLLLSIGEFRGTPETFILPTQALPAGHLQFRVKDATGNYLVRAIAGAGDILNLEQLQTTNTELDRHDYSGAIIVTLGEMAADARTVATQIGSRKQLRFLEKKDLLHRVVQSLPASLESALVRIAEPTHLSAGVVFTDSGVKLILRDRMSGSWFQVLEENGAALPESSELVAQLRSELPALRHARYGAPDAREDRSIVSRTFNRAAYLSKSYEHFDNVKYAPLAALGLRFKAASLSEIYIEPSAQVGGSSKRSLALTRAVSEFVDSLNLPSAHREQLELQLRSRHGLTGTAEVGAARKLYHRFNNVLVLGDPGSGKTCFVKHEILAYCDPPANEFSWYSRHLPIYVSLAEAARLVSDSSSLLDACEILAARRGVDLPRAVIEDALSSGTAALFFDGLDEVGFLDKRIVLLNEIDRLVRTYAARGSRFVLTSRPAAIQPVDVPEALTYLQLSGLTEPEIRLLAERVLSNRFGTGESGLLDRDEAELIDKLLDDTKLKPGIARIARNPLLLTLLVLIYANSGALSARRHVIYTQAVKSLVSVRGRQTRQQQISESDLRTRLGALALAILRREIAEIPRKQEVLQLLRAQMKRSGSGALPPAQAADAYLQEVAEATGILAIHSADDPNADQFVSFMHFSFLEYYAAAGLLSGSYLEDVPKLANNPRWRDVTTLLFGLLSEQADVSPLFGRLLRNETAADAISQYKLLLALDCANECDVPPEDAQESLADAIFQCVNTGAGRYSSDLRAEIAKRLDSLVMGGTSRIERALMNGISQADALSAAAFTDLLARLGEDVILSEELTSEFDRLLDSENASVRAAAISAIESRPELRSNRAVLLIRRCLRGSVVEQHAALKIVGTVPSYAEQVTSDLRHLLDDSNSIIAAEAAECLLLESLRGGRVLDSTGVIEKALRTLDRAGADDREFGSRSITIDPTQLDAMLLSTDLRERELAIRFVPWVQNDHAYVHSVLMHRVRQEEAPRIQAACLTALRLSPGAVSLVTIADTDAICGLAASPNRNVRIEAIRLLGEMPDDEQVVETLRLPLDEYEQDRWTPEETLEAAKALSKHVRRNPRLRESTLTSVLERLPKRPEDGFGDPKNQQHLEALLLVCEAIGGVAEDGVAWKLYRLATDYRTPLRIRLRALRVFGRIVEPSAASAAAIEKLLEVSDARLDEASYAAALAFALHSKRKVEYVRRVFPQLSKIQDRLCICWEREVARKQETINPPSLTYIRDAIVEVANLMMAYEEFSGRATLGSS